MSSIVHLEYPFHDLRSGSGVLSAALALFGPSDPVEVVVSAPIEQLTHERAEEFRRLRAELALPYGEPGQMRLVDSATAAALPAVARVRATGDPAQDARAILALGSVGRHLSSGYGVGRGWLRGTPELVRADLEAAFVSRQRRRRLHYGVPLHGPVRMAVLLQRIQVWSAVDSIVSAALERSDVELDVVLLPDQTPSYQGYPRDEVEAFVAARGAKLRGVEWLRSALPELDVLVVPDPYITAANTAPGLSPLEIAATGVRVVLAPYAQALSGQPVNLGMLHNQPFHNMAWRIFAPSRGAVANYARHCTAGADHVRYVGSAKRERLLSDEAGAAQARELRGRLRTRSVVLWNPHFVGDRELSTFQEMVQPILSYFSEHRGIGMVVCPHPRLFRELLFSGHQESVDMFRDACGRLPNVVLDESMDATPALLAADAMISDLSSLIAEYHVLGRPIGLLRPTADLALNEDREWFESVSTIDGLRDLHRFLDRVRAARPVAAQQQEDLGAGARVVETIVREFTEERKRATS